MGVVTDHVNENKKAYTGAVVSGVGAAVADHVANILMWLIQLSGLVMPDGVQSSTRYLLVAAVTGVAVRYVSNTPRGG